MRLSDIDLRHLRVFLAVVECGGFSAAESVLGISQSTISTHVAELERRLGYRLCERGRSGFVLSGRGAELHAATLRLVGALVDFEEDARALKGVLAGRLRLALIDNLISDPNCPVSRALASLDGLGRGPRISIEVLPPSEIEHAVAVGRVDVGVSIMEKRLPALRYTPLYSERDVLVCGAAHRLFPVADDDEIRREARTATKVVRSFLNHHDFFLVSDREETIGATVTNVEAAAFLILAGTHIGFLPEHYAARWLRSGEMRTLLPAEFNRTSEIVLIEPLRAAAAPPVVRRFLSAVLAAEPVASAASMRRSKRAAGSLKLAGRSSAQS